MLLVTTLLFFLMGQYICECVYVCVCIYVCVCMCVCACLCMFILVHGHLPHSLLIIIYLSHWISLSVSYSHRFYFSQILSLHHFHIFYFYQSVYIPLSLVSFFSFSFFLLFFSSLFLFFSSFFLVDFIPRICWPCYAVRIQSVRESVTEWGAVYDNSGGESESV